MFIVLEGLDGAGKSTQIRMLRQLLAERGVESEYVHFPRFDAPVYGELIARFLRGGFGGGGRSRGFVAARERDGTDESGGGGGEKLGVECHDVVGVQLLAVSVLLLRALSYMYAVSRMAVRPTVLPSLRFPSFVR